MKIEYNAVLPPENKRFQCRKCGSRFIAEKDEWEVEQEHSYLPPTYVSFCPICGEKVKQQKQTEGRFIPRLSEE